MSDENGAHVTRRELGTELRAFRNEMRVLIVVTFIGGQVIARPDIAQAVAASTVGGLLYLATFFFTRSG